MLSEEKDVNLKQQAAQQHRIIKDIEMTKKKLAHERSLKLDAFQRVDDLQALVSRNLSLYIVWCRYCSVA